MSEVTVKYKDEVIADLPNGGACILRTANKYCEDDVSVEYAPRHKSYELTFSSTTSQAGTPLYLVDLEGEVLEHINDLALQVSFYRTEVSTISKIVHMVFCGNSMLSYQYNISTGASYGLSAASPSSVKIVFRRADSTLARNVDGNGCAFLIKDGKYYLLVTNGSIVNGTYNLTFSW